MLRAFKRGIVSERESSLNKELSRLSEGKGWHHQRLLLTEEDLRPREESASLDYSRVNKFRFDGSGRYEPRPVPMDIKPPGPGGASGQKDPVGMLKSLINSTAKRRVELTAEVGEFEEQEVRRSLSRNGVHVTRLKVQESDPISHRGTGGANWQGRCG